MTHVYKAIKTKYFGPTDVRGSRIKASDADKNSITISYPDAKRNENAHLEAAEALVAKMGWKGELIAGYLGKGEYVFVFVN